MDLKNKEWREFTIGELFSISIGKNIDGNKINKNSGKKAYITRKENNNGLDGFVNYSNDYLNDQYPVITIGNETSEPFIHNYPFFTGTKVNILKPYSNLSRDCLFFIAQALKMHKTKYSYSYTINSTRLKKQKILLPLNDKNEPDYAFMEACVRELEKRKQDEYLSFLQHRIEELKDIPKPISLKNKQWKEFFIEDVLQIKSGKRLIKAEMKAGKIPFIGASDSNNGITQFISNENVSLDKNILGVNYNGSVVENFYHPYEAIFSDDVKRLSLKEIEGNKYLYLFFKI